MHTMRRQNVIGRVKKMAEVEKGSDALATEAPKAPITFQRKVRDDLDQTIPKPGK